MKRIGPNYLKNRTNLKKLASLIYGGSYTKTTFGQKDKAEAIFITCIIMYVTDPHLYLIIPYLKLHGEGSLTFQD